MNLVIDIGNTTWKAASFEKGALKQVLNTDSTIKNLLQNSDFDKAIISSVAQVDQELIQDIPIPVLHLKGTTPVPFRNNYTTPATLGTDRLAAVAGAFSLFPATNCLVFDAGTCITCDFIDSKGTYMGGSISPGIKMRLKALNSFTSRLPLVDPEQTPVPLSGTSTRESILSGVINGAVAEMEGMIRKYKDKYADLKVLLCGGDSRFFESSLKESIFAVPELVLIGLNTILEYNVPQK